MSDILDRLFDRSDTIEFSTGRKTVSKKRKFEKVGRTVRGIEAVSKALIYTDKLILTDTELDHRTDGYIDLGFDIWSKYAKTIPSEVGYPGYYDERFIQDLFVNGTLMVRKCTEWGSTDTEDTQINYYFLYKKHVVHVCHHAVGHYIPGGAGSFSDTPVLGSIWTWSNIDTPPIIEEILKYKLADKPEKASIGIIKQNKYGPYVGKMELDNSNVYDSGYYNDDFEGYLNNLQDQLSDEQAGLYLMHGEPGTGKSSAIRHLLSVVDREFIFIPPQMIHSLSSPEFTDILTRDHKGCVLVLEDAEKALMKREEGDGFSNSTLVSSVLNLTDGLYADLTKSAIIATYNCDRNLIDPALLRKGRLKSEYRFHKLSKEKSQILMNNLGHDILVEDDMTLADIFNHEKQYSNNEEGHKPKRKVGFGFNQ